MSKFKVGVQFVESNVIKPVHTPEYNPDISLHNTDISLSSPPDMPKEYYDSMVVEYFNEQEKLYDFFTPAD